MALLEEKLKSAELDESYIDHLSYERPHRIPGDLGAKRKQLKTQMIQRALQAVPAASNEEVPDSGIGLRGWFRALNVGRSWGCFRYTFFSTVMTPGQTLTAAWLLDCAKKLAQKAGWRCFRNGVGMSIVSH